MPTSESRTGLIGGIGGGVAAFGLGYLLTYALTISTVRDSSIAQLAEAFGDGGAAWKMVGWVFFNAHGATTTLNVNVPIFGGTSAVNFIAESEAFSTVLYGIPPALLLIAGLAAARMAGATELGDALRIGPAVVAGYLPLALIGAVLFTISVEGSTGQPTLVTTIGLAGVVYPAVFGTIGAAVGTVLASGESRREAAA
ncbi:hypothetical protein SAMN05216559_1127 [Halomicrobium zhouii]|uniref:DUF7978 domain-containing protein n=1 Tax=Halomicrobium zhouii TaxID=767519 RepID=A0A1I6KNB7_9EURY|nr:hypothetical protein [Halomicrobium zhouii]SFR92677.1 hypothetical protein SAMN05216559_1127 [Halomicrobium zhouii]